MWTQAVSLSRSCIRNHRPGWCFLHQGEMADFPLAGRLFWNWTWTSLHGCSSNNQPMVLQAPFSSQWPSRRRRRSRRPRLHPRNLRRNPHSRPCMELPHQRHSLLHRQHDLRHADPRPKRRRQAEPMSLRLSSAQKGELQMYHSVDYILFAGIYAPALLARGLCKECGLVD